LVYSSEVTWQSIFTNIGVSHSHHHQVCEGVFTSSTHSETFGHGKGWQNIDYCVMENGQFAGGHGGLLGMDEAVLGIRLILVVWRLIQPVSEDALHVAIDL
jgi:hypothetical protein